MAKNREKEERGAEFFFEDRLNLFNEIVKF